MADRMIGKGRLWSISPFYANGSGAWLWPPARVPRFSLGQHPRALIRMEGGKAKQPNRPIRMKSRHEAPIAAKAQLHARPACPE